MRNEVDGLPDALDRLREDYRTERRDRRAVGGIEDDDLGQLIIRVAILSAIGVVRQLGLFGAFRALNIVGIRNAISWLNTSLAIPLSTLRGRRRRRFLTHDSGPV
jgi:hypothetical protein